MPKYLNRKQASVVLALVKLDKDETFRDGDYRYRDLYFDINHTLQLTERQIESYYNKCLNSDFFTDADDYNESHIGPPLVRFGYIYYKVKDA